MKQTNKHDGSATAGVAAENSKGIVVDFVRKEHRFLLPLAELPLENERFVVNLLKAGCSAASYRSTKGGNELPAGGGTVDMDTFIKAICALEFRGDDKPTEADVKAAKPFVNGVAAGLYTFDDLAKRVKEQYGWNVTPDAEGLARHAMLKRLKEAAELGTLAKAEAI